MDELKRPKVGVAVIVIKDNKYLLGNRKNSDGSFHWTIPGGKIEFGESFESCALREVEEESGLKVELIDKSPFAVTNDIFKEGHFVSLFYRANYKLGEPKIKEPEKFKEWKWFSLNDIPSPLSPTVQNLLKQNLNLFKE
jgi:8-oxo-dGTP diphosphatase